MSPRPNRATTIALLRVAGYHDDKRAWARLYVEGRIRVSLAQQLFDEGRQLRAKGVPCACPQCNPQTPGANP